jgi:hypothetical protein
MSKGQPGYRLDHVVAAKEQIASIAAIARTAGKFPELIDVLKKAVHFLQGDPHGWGDPERHLVGTDAVVSRGIVRPLVFRYVIYEQLHAVVLLSVQKYADFD